MHQIEAEVLPKEAIEVLKEGMEHNHYIEVACSLKEAMLPT